jgi:hypothetical protein
MVTALPSALSRELVHVRFPVVNLRPFDARINQTSEASRARRCTSIADSPRAATTIVVSERRHSPSTTVRWMGEFSVVPACLTTSSTPRGYGKDARHAAHWLLHRHPLTHRRYRHYSRYRAC